MQYKGYTFNNEQDAINARQQAADYMGYPINPDDVTIYWVDFNYSELDGFWYIMHVEELEKVLGEPIEFEITQNENI